MALTKVSNSMLVQPVNHNILINPSFTVTQRGTVVEHPAISFGPDRWIFSGVGQSGGTKVESSTEVDDVTGINKLVVKHEGTTTGEAWVRQYIETINLLGLYGKEMTFSFGYSETGGSGIPKVLVRSYDSLGTSKLIYNAAPTPLGDNRWTHTFTLSTEDGTIPKLVDRGLDVLIYSNEQNNAPTEWSVWETKLEAGSVATPFIARSYAEERLLCDRYFQRITIGSRAPLPCVRRGNDHIGIRVDLRTEMRRTPTYTAGTTISDQTSPAFYLKAHGSSETFLNPTLAASHTNWVLLAKNGLSTSLILNDFYHTEVDKSVLYFEAEL